MYRFYLIAVFFVALAIQLWFNFTDAQIINAGAADGSEYLRDAKALSQFLKHEPSFYFTQSPELKAELAKLKGFSQSGYIFPAYILFTWIVSGSPHEVSSWVAPVAGQCVLAAAACVFLSLTGKLVWGTRAGVACGILAALYPAYIVNTGRLYTESFATSLICPLLYTICRGFLGKRRQWWEFLALGLNLGVLQLTRSLMVIMSALAFPLVFMQEKLLVGAAVSSEEHQTDSAKYRPLSMVIVLLVGILIVLLPWFYLQKGIFDKTSIVVDRVGNYNLFIGTNPSISGWLSYPYPDGRGVESRSAISVLNSNVKQSPSKFLKLLCDKPFRLFKFHWNDFRTNIGLISFQMQVAFHQHVLLFFLIGVILALVRNSDGSKVDKGQLLSRIFLFLFLASHCLYWLFITVPRYNMTSTPILLLFAGAGIAALLDLASRRRVLSPLIGVSAVAFFFSARMNDLGPLVQPLDNHTAALALLCVLKGTFAILFFLAIWFCFFKNSPKSEWSSQGPDRFALPVFLISAVSTVILVALPVRANGRQYEWQCEVEKKGHFATQVIHIPEDANLESKQLFLLVDADGLKDLCENGQITLNGTLLDGPFIPGVALTQDFSAPKDNGQKEIYYECEWIYDCMTKSAGLSNADLRQWMWIPVPPNAVEYIREKKLAKVVVENVGEKPIKIYGSYAEPKGSLTVPSIDSTSWEKSFYGVENDKGLTDCRYDLKFESGITVEGKSSAGESAEVDSEVSSTKDTSYTSGGRRSTDLSPAAGIQKGRYSILLAAVPGDAARKIQIEKLGQKTLQIDKNMKLSASISETEKIFKDDVWIVRLRGKSESTFFSYHKKVVNPSMSILLDKDGEKLTYPVRWLPRQLPNDAKLRRFDYCFPLMPAQLPGKITGFDLSFHCPPGRSGNQHSKLIVSDLSLEIFVLPNNPLVNKTGIY